MRMNLTRMKKRFFASNIAMILMTFTVAMAVSELNPLQAAGAVLVDTGGNGQPVLWRNGVVRYNLESGAAATLGTLNNDEAVALVRELFEDWQTAALNGIGTTSVTFVEGASLGSVDTTNVNEHFTYCPPNSRCPNQESPFITGSAESGESPILFDADGSMTDMLEGVGASHSILGFAGPRVVENVGGRLYITEGQAVLNGKFIDGVRNSGNPETDIDAYKGVVLHELGHFIGLDHTQVNLASVIKYLDDDPSEKEGIPTMFPLYVDGNEQLSLHYDDKVAISSLYPSSGFSNSFCRLEGTVFRSDGTTELQGVNVVLKSVADPILETTSSVSGSLYAGASSGCEGAFGDYTLYGLIPGHQYSLSIEKISRTFIRGSSIEPCDPPQTGFEERTLSGSFSCATAGQVIHTGTTDSSSIVTTKQVVATSATSPGCSLAPLKSGEPAVFPQK